jgi:hypothetical protein
MRKIRIHLNDSLRIPIENFLKPVEIGRTQSHFPGAMQNIDAFWMCPGKVFRDLTGAIGAVVIHNKQLEVERKRK